LNPRILESLNLFNIFKVILLTLSFTLIFGIFSVEIRDPDFWWHLRTGQLISETGSIPATDPFAYTSLPKDPINPESKRIKFILSQYWLSQVIFYRIYDYFSFGGIIFLRALLLTLLVFFTYSAVRREGFGFVPSIILIVPLVMILRTYTGERPQLFSFLFSFLLIYLIEGFRRKERGGDSKERDSRGQGVKGPSEKGNAVIVGTETTSQSLPDSNDEIAALPPVARNDEQAEDKGGCYSPDNENRSKQPPAPPLLRGNKAEDSAGTYTETSSQPVFARSPANRRTTKQSLPDPNNEIAALPPVARNDKEQHGHCEEQSDVAISPLPPEQRDRRASLAMTMNSTVIARSETMWQSLLWFFLPSLRGAERRGNLFFASLKTRLLHFVRNDIQKATDKSYGELLPEDHPHPNPPPSMGREIPSQPVSISLDESQLVSTSLHQSPQVSPSLHKSPSVPSLIYLLPILLIMLLWANLHGGFILGILIMVAYLAAEWTKFFTKKLGTALPPRRIKLLTATGVVAILLSLVNPNGYNVIAFLIEFERGQYKELIVESMPPLTLIQAGLYSPQFLIYFVILSLCALLFILNIRRAGLTDILVTGGLAAMSLTASRFIPFFAPVGILMIARYSADFLNRLPGTNLLDNIVKKYQLFLYIILSIALIIAINSSDLFKQGVRENKFPSGAAKFLKENRIEGNMFNPYIWGGYLIWSLYPDYRVFIDGRGLIGEVFFQQVNIMEANPKKVEGIPQWKAILKAYNTDYIITYSVGNFTGRLVPLIPALLNDEEWHLVYMDNISLIFVRESDKNREVIERFGLRKEWLWSEVAVEAALKAKDYGGNINYYITMGDALLSNGSYGDAKQAFLRAQNINPQNAYVRQRLELLRSMGY